MKDDLIRTNSIPCLIRIKELKFIEEKQAQVFLIAQF